MVTIPENIEQKWRRGWRITKSDMEKLHRAELDKSIGELREYIETGKLVLPVARERPQVEPPFEDWESVRLCGALATLGEIRCFEAERNSEENESFNFLAAFRAFEAFELLTSLDLVQCKRYSQRFGREDRMMTAKTVGKIALGAILGQTQRSAALFRIYATYAQRGCVFDQDYLPAYRFQFRLMAQHYDTGVPDILNGEMEFGPLNQLLANLYSENFDEIVDDLSQVCDFHMYRSVGKRGEEFIDYDLGPFVRLPVEALLVFALRKDRGLDNGRVDHCMMSAPFDQLPPTTDVEPDPLISAVRQRMEADGFDWREACSDCRS
ncbi:hypothetical protein [Maricaulis sp.]|uniref:hypothetical protein n=1 Tax=Maricaulis sp. TaxID=1486257 RepID=UPI001B0C74F0|nr:hypothetical protein [Maricaulis sp.]MBO6797100.1 hypothetical protein [Maricaulis sp.]